MAYDNWKTDPEYGLSHRDLREAELRQERDDLDDEVRALKDKLDAAETKIARLERAPTPAPYPNDLLTDICTELVDLLTPEQIACFAADIPGECENIVQDRNEAAWEAMQEREPDDSKYRQDMRDAGRGHLLK